MDEKIGKLVDLVDEAEAWLSKAGPGRRTHVDAMQLIVSAREPMEQLCAAVRELSKENAKLRKQNITLNAEVARMQVRTAELEEIELAHRACDYT